MTLAKAKELLYNFGAENNGCKSGQEFLQTDMTPTQLFEFVLKNMGNRIGLSLKQEAFFESVFGFLKLGFAPEKYNWEDFSWAVAEYCPEKLDGERYNWKDDSWAVAEYCPEKLDGERYNWKDDSWAVAEYCPEKLDPERYNWEDDSWAVAEHCPEKMSLRPKNNSYKKER